MSKEKETVNDNIDSEETAKKEKKSKKSKTTKSKTTSKSSKKSKSDDKVEKEPKKAKSSTKATKESTKKSSKKTTKSTSKKTSKKTKKSNEEIDTSIPMKCRCLALDNSRYSTGWCVADIDTTDDSLKETEGIKLIEYGYIDTSLVKREGHTLQIIEEEFELIIDTYKPDVIVSEQMFIGKNAGTGMVLAGIHSIMKLCAFKRNIPVVYYSIMTLKTTTIKDFKYYTEDGVRKDGDMMKKEVMQSVFNFFHNHYFHKITDDVTDAISIVITYKRKRGIGVGSQSFDTFNYSKKKRLFSTGDDLDKPEISKTQITRITKIRNIIYNLACKKQVDSLLENGTIDKNAYNEMILPLLSKAELKKLKKELKQAEKST